jgi:hypothetical protein
VVSAGSLPAACRVAADESFDLVVLDYDLLAGHFLESVAEGAKLFLLPRLLLVADRGSWGPCDEAGPGLASEILWKPLDAGALFDRMQRTLALPRTG